ncbi:MAG: hypothetical protein IKL80_03305, partial [Clostridia bacterium]|nr:hypothetical protein [Clostridia bacterium]
MEKNYEFRKKLTDIHTKNLRKADLLPNAEEFALCDGFVIDISAAGGDVVLTAAKDFQDYMLTSMCVSGRISLRESGTDTNVIRVVFDTEGNKLSLAKGYMGYQIAVSDQNITITAYDERGAAQAFYRMEDIMTLKRAPFLSKEVIENKAMFSPRMVHSGYDLDQFPDSHLRDIAHAGMDAVLVFTKGPNMSARGYLDFNDLIYRAAKYGIDVYSYSYIKSEMHPDAPGAEGYYDNTYGRVFKECPGLRGVVLVGESVAFPSRDPHTSGTTARVSADGIPSVKIHPGWWPCHDYPQWLSLLGRVIKKYNPDADLVFWSYNWGWAPAEDRVRLIEALPKDVSLLVTYEMHEVYEKNGIKEKSADYTLSLPGPGQYFISEAEAAQKAGIRLYAMTNTGGLTWDFGSIPYEPFPQQWQKRYDSMKLCYERYGLCGLMESHHYGFYPSFISELAKWNFTCSTKEKQDILQALLASRYGEENVEIIDRALSLWSEGICHYDAVAADQYGAFRIGPAYPLCFNRRMVPPASPHASIGIMEPKYEPFTWYTNSLASIPPMSIHSETESLKAMSDLMLQGISLMEAIPQKNEALNELLGLGKYIQCTIETAIHVKRFAVAHVRLNSAMCADEMKKQI